MQNLELKSKCADLAAAGRLAAALGAQRQWRRQQIDTYFKVATGKLKLREEEGQTAELIAYNRTAQPDAKISDYDIYAIDDPLHFKQMLGGVLHVLVVVKKQRELYLWENVRIHLDSVENLGRFLELEAVLDATNDVVVSRQRIHALMHHFQIKDDDLMSVGYFELLKEQIENVA